MESNRKSFVFPQFICDILKGAAAVDGISQTELITQLVMSARTALKSGFYLEGQDAGSPECVANILESYQQRLGGELSSSKSDTLLEYLLTDIFPNVVFDPDALATKDDYIKANLQSFLIKNGNDETLEKLRHGVFSPENVRELAAYLVSQIADKRYYSNPFLFRIFVVALRDCASWKENVCNTSVYPASKQIIEELFR